MIIDRKLHFVVDMDQETNNLFVIGDGRAGQVDLDQF